MNFNYEDYNKYCRDKEISPSQFSSLQEFKLLIEIEKREGEF